MNKLKAAFDTIAAVLGMVSGFLFGKQDGFYGWLAHVPILNDPERKTYGDLLSELGGSSPYDFTPAMLNLSDSSRADYMKNAQMGATPPHSLKVN